MASIKVPCQGCDEQVLLDAKRLAQSACDNNVDIVGLRATMDNFSNASESSLDDIMKWRDEVVATYFDIMQRKGLLKLKRTVWKGGSDYDEPGTAPGSNKK